MSCNARRSRERGENAMSSIDLRLAASIARSDDQRQRSFACLLCSPEMKSEKMSGGGSAIRLFRPVSGGR
ncbi:hypothetical protein JCGZ_06913 [Jatropha curcas]|uniref:Uncharacterized protein n=1 Tax=Jatropha curcas TaxID=180498 RepID=A0A067KR29_JATCU|nr:hypothetical protein JCGZ_06913 [Jatropha curcas]